MNHPASSKNIHEGSDFDEWLKEEGIYEEVSDRGLKKALAADLSESSNPVCTTVPNRLLG